MKQLAWLVVFFPSVIPAVYGIHPEMDHLSNKLVSQLEQKDFSILPSGMSQDDILKWGTELWLTVVWGISPSEDDLVMQMITREQSKELYHLIAETSSFNHSNVSGEIPGKEKISLNVCYHFTQYVRGILLPELAIHASKQKWNDFLTTYRRILFTIPCDSDSFQFNLTPLAIIIPQFVCYSTPPDSVLGHMEEDIDRLINTVLNKQNTIQTEDGKSNFLKTLLCLYCIKVNLKLARHHVIHHCWPERVASDLFPENVNGRIEYELKKTGFQYNLSIMGRSGREYCGTVESFPGPRLFSGQTSSGDKKEFLEKFGRWNSFKILKK